MTRCKGPAEESHACLPAYEEEPICNMKRAYFCVIIQFISVLFFLVAQVETFVLPRTLILRTPPPHAALFVSSQRDRALHNAQNVDVPVLLKNVQNLLEQRNISSHDSSRKAILSRLDERQAADCKSARVLAVEEDKSQSISPPNYTWISAGEKHSQLAIQSLVPILNATDIHTLVGAAEDYWQEASTQKSRFTYQRVGNSEAHISDLGHDAKQVMNRLLVESVYPLVREAFCTTFTQEEIESQCVYDALLIRYNATQASAGQGAGQPLHRDFGIVSVNIMLNEEFQGGGTFFENQLLENSTTSIPLKPRGKGHCLAHLSSQRHAGAVTMDGVRDVLVIFVMADGVTPRLLRNARLKQSARKDCEQECEGNVTEYILCRIQHQLMAIEAVPDDGEAFQYLGTALMDYAGQVSDAVERDSLFNDAIECFRHAAVLTPCDSRVYSNLGLALSKQGNEAPSVINAYEKAWDILERSSSAGCDVENEWDALSLNYGLYLANLDRFAEVYRVLERTARKKKAALEGNESTATSRVIEDAFRLWQFCEQNMQD
jgi:hypothetical protein